MPALPATPASARTAPVAIWIIAVLLALIAGALLTRAPAGGLLPAAYAQNQPMAGARGVFAFTGQIDHTRYGLFMLDVDAGTIWCYEIDSLGGTRKLRLLAARTFIYDRYLQDFNCGQPSFRDVQQLVSQQRLQAAPGAPDANVDTSASRVEDAPGTP